MPNLRWVVITSEKDEIGFEVTVLYHPPRNFDITLRVEPASQDDLTHIERPFYDVMCDILKERGLTFVKDSKSKPQYAVNFFDQRGMAPDYIEFSLKLLANGSMSVHDVRVLFEQEVANYYTVQKGGREGRFSGRGRPYTYSVNGNLVNNRI